MRIGLITDDYHPRVDGVVVYIDTMSQALIDLGHEVYIICPKYPDNTNSEGSVIRVSSIDPLPLSKLKSSIMLTRRKDLAHTEQLGLDIIHAHTQAGANFFGYRLSQKMGKKLVTTMHTTYHPLAEVYPATTAISTWFGNVLSWIHYQDSRPLLSVLRHPIPVKKTINKWIDSYMKSILDHSDEVLVNSNHTYKYVKSFGSDTHMTIVRNGIDTTPFKRSERKVIAKTPLRLVYASRVSGEKHQELTIKAVNILKKRGANVQLTIVGDGPHRKYCENLSKKLNLGDRVSFVGEISQKEVARVLKKNDIGLIASYHFDTNPLSVMEYLAAGLPVVYCDENFDSMFEENSAIKCEFSAESFADAVETLNNSQTLEEMSRAALKASRKHDINVRARELVEFYKSIDTKSEK